MKARELAQRLLDLAAYLPGSDDVDVVVGGAANTRWSVTGADWTLDGTKIQLDVSSVMEVDDGD